MSYTYSFFDNQLIGVDELNKITSRFVTGGVAREPSSVSDLNGFVSDVATKGVVGDTSDELKVTLENGKIKINTGTAFFDNGTVIEVTEPELIDYTAGTAVNVYLKSDMNNNSIYPVCSESLPESEEKGRNGITNSNSVGVEICVNRDGDFEKAKKNAQTLVKRLMKELDIPIDRVVRHFDVSGKNCPQSFSASDWENFKKGLAEELTDIDEIVAELVQRGIVTDKEGMLLEMKQNPHGRLYWLARKMLNELIRQGR